MPYPTTVDGPALVNYQSAPRPTDDADGVLLGGARRPGHAVLQAYVGDPVRVHVLGAPGSEQPHVIRSAACAGGRPAPPGANTVEAAAVSPWTTTDIQVIGGPAARAAWSATCGTATSAGLHRRPACGA